MIYDPATATKRLGVEERDQFVRRSWAQSSRAGVPFGMVTAGGR